MAKENGKRDSFRSRWGFILACIGSAVGMGNIWRFPILVSVYGGLSFLIPYFIFVVLIASTGVIEEYALGRAAGAGPVGAFALCAEKKGRKKLGAALGYVPIVGSLGLSIGYTVVFAWICKYVKLAVTGDLSALGQDMAAIGGAFGATAPEATADTTLPEWTEMISGAATVWIVVAVLITFVIMAAGIAKGIETANRVMMPLLFGLFVVLCFIVAFLPGSGAGFRYILSFNRPIDGETLLYAFGQAFFSLSVAGNGSVIYGSYLSAEEDIPSSARKVAFFDTLAALLAAFVVIPSMAAAGVEPSSGGPGLMFVYLVNVFNGMAVGRIVSMIFFIAVFFAGLSSIINLYEAPVALLQEKLGMKRWIAAAVMLLLGAGIAIWIQPITSPWMDVVSIYICPLGALLAAIMFFWVAGKQFAVEQVAKGAKKPVSRWFYPMGKYVFCACALIALLAGAWVGGIG